MNILLLNPPGRTQYTRDYFCSKITKTHYVEQPVDFIILSGILSQRYKINILDAVMLNLDNASAIKKIISLNSDFVIFLSGIVSWKEDFAFLETLKKLCPKLIFIGIGDIFRAKELNKDILENYDFLDAILMDFTAPDILYYLEGKNEKIKNMMFREGKDIVIKNEISVAKEFNIPVPRQELFMNKRYSFPFAKKLPFVTLLTDYGCPFDCSFCVYPTLGFKLRGLENVFAELKYIHSLGIRELFIKDQCFGVNEERTVKFCREIISKKWNFSWTCFLRTDLAKKELLVEMKAAGCHTIIFGVESANQSFLFKNKKGINEENIYSAFGLCNKLGIDTVGTFILGFPGEDKESILSTVELSIRLKCDFASFNLFVPRLSTRAWWEIGEKYSMERLLMDQSGTGETWEHDRLSRRELSGLRRLAVRKFYLRAPYIYKRISKVRSPTELKTLIKNGTFLIKSVFAGGFLLHHK